MYKMEHMRAILTNLDKVFWPKDKITKGDLIRYYEEISPWILPHLKNRPGPYRSNDFQTASMESRSFRRT